MKKLLLILAVIVLSITGWVPLKAREIYWTQLTGNAGWEPRTFSYTLSYNNKLWTVAGSGTTIPTYRNDVWNSTDGVIWNNVTMTATFSKRDAFAGTVFNNKMWISGGDDGELTALAKDVWYSTDGADWTLATGNAAFGGRFYHQMLTFNSKMYIIGGSAFGSTNVNDVWFSTNGSDWTAATRNAEFSPRDNNVVGLGCVSYSGKLWVTGGATPDVWNSSDGVTWTLIKTNPAYGQRVQYRMEVFNGKMWVLGGIQGGNAMRDAWSSTDGVTWIQDAIANWNQRYAFNSTIYNNNVVISAGAEYSQFNDVWQGSLNSPTITPSQTPWQAPQSPTRTPVNTWNTTPQTITGTITRTFTALPTWSSTKTPTAMNTLVSTRTPTSTPTQKRAFTSTITDTYTPYFTFTNTWTITKTSTLTATPTYTWTVSNTFTSTPTSTMTPTFTATVPTTVPTTIETPMIWDISTDIRGGVNQTVSESVGFSRYPDLGVGTNYLFTLTQVGGAGRTVQYSLTNADNLDPSADKRLLYKVDGLLWNNTYTMSLQVSNPVNITTPLIAATVVITPGYTPTPNGWTGLPFSVNRVQGVWIPVLTPGVQPVQVVDLPINFQTPVVAQATVVSAIATSVIPTDVDSWHKRQHMCETVKFGHWNSALTANSTAIYGIYNPSSTVYLHTRFDIACANGTAQVWANKIGFGAAGTTLTARILEPCSAFANSPKVYYAPTPVGTPTDGNQVAEMLFTGVADTTGPTGSKSGMVVGTDGDWFAVAPLSSYVIRIIAGATDIKYELHMGFYQDLD